MHGAREPRRAETKYIIAKNIATAFNRILNSPDLLSLTNEMALLGSRLDQLVLRLETLDPEFNHGEVLAAAEMIHDGFRKSDGAKQLAGIMRLKMACDPLRVESHLWNEIQGSLEIMRRLNDTERKWITANNQMIPIAQVLELIVWFQRLMYRYVPEPNDRESIAHEIRSILPPRN